MELPSELDCRVALHGRNGAERRVKVEANHEECKRIAERLMIPAVKMLTCIYKVMPLQDHSVICDGWLDAQVVLACCVSGELFEDVVSEAFRVRFVTEARESPQDFLDPDLPDEIIFDGQVVDLGALTIEQLALALPPFPRKPDLTAVDAAEDPATTDDDVPTTRPFAHLIHLMSKKSRKGD